MERTLSLYAGHEVVAKPLDCAFPKPDLATCKEPRES